MPHWILKNIARVISFIVQIFSLRLFETSKANLLHCFNSSKLLNKSLYQTALTSLEYPYIWGNPKNVNKLVLGNQEAFINANEKPLLIFTLHMGCVDAMLIYLASNLKGLSILYTPAKNITLDRSIKSARESGGAKMFNISPIEFKKMYKCFKNRQHIAVASDLVPHERGKYSTFFNKECFCLDLIENLSKRSTHQIMFVYFTLGRTKRYKFNYKMLDTSITVDEMNYHFENAIKECPELYGWEYKKFRKLSGDTKNIY